MFLGQGWSVACVDLPAHSVTASTSPQDPVEAGLPSPGALGTGESMGSSLSELQVQVLLENFNKNKSEWEPEEVCAPSHAGSEAAENSLGVVRRTPISKVKQIKNPCVNRPRAGPRAPRDPWPGWSWKGGRQEHCGSSICTTVAAVLRGSHP